MIMKFILKNEMEKYAFLQSLQTCSSLLCNLKSLFPASGKWGRYVYFVFSTANTVLYSVPCLCLGEFCEKVIKHWLDVYTSNSSLEVSWTIFFVSYFSY